MKQKLALIGPGKVGSAVCRRLLAAGYPLQTVIGRDRSRAAEACRFIGCNDQLAGTELAAASKAELVLLAVPDDQIGDLAAQVAKEANLQAGATLVHFSGLHPAEIMRSSAALQLLSIHPLLPFASRELAAERLPGCPCALEGDDTALPLGAELIAAFGGKTFRIASDKKALYHASACLASNSLVTLLGAARDLLATCGIAENDALSLLQPLLQATLDNVLQLGPEQGLTGPIVRGDSGTVAKHLQAIAASSPRLLAIYRQLGSKTLELAAESGRLDAKNASFLARLLTDDAAE